MSVEQMRAALMCAPKYNYSSKARATWECKVKKMPNNQVIAIYLRMSRGGEL